MHRQRRFRARQVAANDDDDPEAGAAPVLQQPARDTARQQGRSRTDTAKQAGLLSFEDDEEGGPDVPAPSRSVRAQPAPVLREEAGIHTQRSAAGLLMQLACQPDAVPLIMSVITASVCDAECEACALQASTPVRSWRSCGSRHGVCRPLRSRRSRPMLAASRCRAASR